jgi:hypothetical protein
MSIFEGSETTWRTSSRHGFSACDGVDSVGRPILEVLEFTCVSAVSAKSRSVAIHKLLGNGENVQLDIRK